MYLADNDYSFVLSVFYLAPMLGVIKGAE